jgi:hypothetical protein
MSPSRSESTGRMRLTVAAAVALSALATAGTATPAGGGGLSTNPASYDFGNVAVGTPVVITVTVTNTGTQTIPSLGIIPEFRGGPDLDAWTATFRECPGLGGLAPGQSCDFQLQFQPNKSGRHKTRLLLKDGMGDSVAMPLAGVGT